jgi:hypothetical protein
LLPTAAGKDVIMKTPAPYRGIEYAVSDNGDGTWVWKLHPKVTPGVAGEIKSGTVPGTQADAIAAAEAAIDAMLGPERD